jgi:hypothetical protein
VEIEYESKLTRPQLAVLAMLQRAYDADIAVTIGGRYNRMNDTAANATAHMATALVLAGTARYSTSGRHLLITDRGRQLAKMGTI